MAVTLRYAKSTCGRCAGKGYFSHWSHIAAGRCFGCNGRGYKLTAAGKRAAAAIRGFITEHFTVPAADLAVGMRVEAPNGLKRTIVGVEPGDAGGVTVKFNKPYENLHGIVMVDTTLVTPGTGLVKVLDADAFAKVVAFARTLKLKGLTIDEGAADAAPAAA